MNQALQQQSSQEFLPTSHQHPRKRSGRRAINLVTAASVLTVFSLALGLAYLAGYARVARNEYRRQVLLQEIRWLTASNARLRFQINAAWEPAHLAAAAAAAGMQQADPAADTDYVLLPPEAGAASRRQASCGLNSRPYQLAALAGSPENVFRYSKDSSSLTLKGVGLRPRE